MKQKPRFILCRQTFSYIYERERERERTQIFTIVSVRKDITTPIHLTNTKDHRDYYEQVYTNKLEEMDIFLET